MYVLLLSSPLALPLSGLRVYIFAADWPLIKDHTPSAGESAGEKGEREREDWIMSGGRHSFGFQSLKPVLGYIP